MNLISLENKVSNFFDYYLLLMVFVMVFLYQAGINVSFILITNFLLFWSWRFKRNHLASINRHALNLLSVITGMGVLCFSSYMMYKYSTGNTYFYYMSDVIAIITLVLSIPFFIPVCSFTETPSAKKRFIIELIIMSLSLIILVIFCGVLLKNGFNTPFTDF